MSSWRRRAFVAAAIVLPVGLWTYAVWRTNRPLRRHMKPDARIPGAFEPPGAYCERRPFWPKFWRRLAGRPWPGDYRCPDHPKDRYVEEITALPDPWVHEAD